MKDIDFDELDKAVNSVLSQNEQAAATAPVTDTATATVVEEPASTTTDTPTVTDEPAAPEPTEEVAAEVEVAQPETAPVMDTAQPTEVNPVATQPTSLATKRRGKFMDVVHPSSDMNPAAPTAPASPATPVVVAPVSPDLTTETPEASPASSDPTPTDEVTAPQELETPFAPEVDLSSLQLDTTDAVAPEVTTAVAAETETAPEVVEAVADADVQASAETPFIADAKVEKRPLGAFGDQEAESTTEAPAESAPAGEESEPAAESQPLDIAAAPVEPTPRELQSDIVEVEKVQDDTEHETSEATPAVTTVTSDTGITPPTGEVAHDEDAHPVFDASTYQQPLAATKPVKKKSTWLWWVGGILGCLVVGGGVGYALFVIGF